MARATCFRCDWVGEADGEACPRCGTAWYRPEPSSPAGPSRTGPLVGPSGAASPVPSEPPPPRSGYLPASQRGDPGGTDGRRAAPRGAPFAAFVALAAILTGGLWWFLRAHEVPPGAGDGAPPPPSGRLVYVAGDPGGQRLWTWDPRTGTVTEGPRVEDEVVQLVSAQGALAGWLGVTSRDPDGVLEAAVLRAQTPQADPVHLRFADRVAWGPNGASVATASLGSASGGCYSWLRVVRERLDGSPDEEVLRRAPFCGEAPALGQTLAATYLTWERRGGTGIFFVGNGVPHQVLDGWSLISASPTSDLLVRPAGGTPAGAALFWRGAVRPDRYRGPNGGEVVVDRILAWTISADAALVVANADDREGTYLLDTTPGGDREARYVGILREPVSATAAFDGSLFVAMQGRLMAWTEGRLVEMDLPSGAPRPSGPIAWMPG